MRIGPLSDTKADVSSVYLALRIWRMATARNVSFLISKRWQIHIINPADKTKLPCYTSTRRSARFSLETYPFWIFVLSLKTIPRKSTLREVVMSCLSTTAASGDQWNTKTKFYKVL